MDYTLCDVYSNAFGPSSEKPLYEIKYNFCLYDWDDWVYGKTNKWNYTPRETLFETDKFSYLLIFPDENDTILVEYKDSDFTRLEDLPPPANFFFDLPFVEESDRFGIGEVKHKYVYYNRNGDKFRKTNGPCVYWFNDRCFDIKEPEYYFRGVMYTKEEYLARKYLNKWDYLAERLPTKEKPNRKLFYIRMDMEIDKLQKDLDIALRPCLS